MAKRNLGIVALFLLGTLGLNSCDNDVFKPHKASEVAPQYELSYMEGIGGSEGEHYAKVTFVTDEFASELKEGNEVLFEGEPLEYHSQNLSYGLKEVVQGYPRYQGEGQGEFTWNADNGKTYKQIATIPEFVVDPNTVPQRLELNSSTNDTIVVSFSPALGKDEAIIANIGVKFKDESGDDPISVTGSLNGFSATTNKEGENTINLVFSRNNISQLISNVNLTKENGSIDGFSFVFKRIHSEKVTGEGVRDGQSMGSYQTNPDNHPLNIITEQ